MNRIKTGDKVIVISGKDKGKTGKVLQVFKAKQRASVEGVNLMYKNLAQQSADKPGQKVKFPAPIHLSNLALLDPEVNKATRVYYEWQGSKKVRLSRKSKQAI